MNAGAWVVFELHAGTGSSPFRIRVRDAGERSMALVTCGSREASGIGATARDALEAALAPFGPRTTGAVLAAPAMFAASAALLAAREVG